MTDPTKRKMKMPAWHLPYLEKHNIYKLFYELSRELVVHQPDDHVFFVKYLLTNAVKAIHTPHVILLGSPHINLYEVARLIRDKTQMFMITGQMIMELLKLDDRSKTKPSDIVLAIQTIINTNYMAINEHGWIFVDCITTKHEAQKLLDVGILPTHVIYLISPYAPKLTDLLYCNVSSNWPQFRRNMITILEVYKKKLIEVFLHEVDIDSLVGQCVELIGIEHIEKGPRTPRVLIMGPRGSGRKTQAKLLAQKMNLVHIDFEYLLCQTWIGDTELGAELRACGDQACFNSALLTRILNRRLLDVECATNGWVLTGYPFNALDFKYIDCLETPPNRVIFLECDLNVCIERLTRRKVNVETGSTTKLLDENPLSMAVDSSPDTSCGCDDMNIDLITSKRLKMHPKDKPDLINAELQYYCTHYGSIRKYCGGTAAAINADQPERWVHENIVAAVTRDLSMAPARDPFDDRMPLHAELVATMPYKFFHHD